MLHSPFLKLHTYEWIRYIQYNFVYIIVFIVDTYYNMILRIYAYTHQKAYRQIRQNIIRIFVPWQWKFECFILALFPIVILVFSKFCSINLCYFYKDKKLVVWRLEGKRTDKKSSSGSSECSKCLKSNGFPDSRLETEPPESENCGQLCPLPSTVGQCPVILNLWLASIPCGPCEMTNPWAY